MDPVSRARSLTPSPVLPGRTGRSGLALPLSTWPCSRHVPGVSFTSSHSRPDRAGPWPAQWEHSVAEKPRAALSFLLSLSVRCIQQAVLSARCGGVLKAVGVLRSRSHPAPGLSSSCRWKRCPRRTRAPCGLLPWPAPCAAPSFRVSLPSLPTCLLTWGPSLVLQVCLHRMHREHPRCVSSELLGPAPQVCSHRPERSPLCVRMALGCLPSSPGVSALSGISPQFPAVSTWSWVISKFL